MDWSNNTAVLEKPISDSLWTDAYQRKGLKARTESTGWHNSIQAERSVVLVHMEAAQPEKIGFCSYFSRVPLLTNHSRTCSLRGDTSTLTSNVQQRDQLTCLLANTCQFRVTFNNTIPPPPLIHFWIYRFCCV